MAGEVERIMGLAAEYADSNHDRRAYGGKDWRTQIEVARAALRAEVERLVAIEAAARESFANDEAVSRLHVALTLARSDDLARLHLERDRAWKARADAINVLDAALAGPARA